MWGRINLTLAALLLLPLLASAQLRAVRVDTLQVGHDRTWAHPSWSPDGKTVYFTASDFNGIWAAPAGGGRVTQITSDRGSGYGFVLSGDGARISWRRTLPGVLPGERLQEVVVRDLPGGSPSVLASGRSVSLPAFVQSEPVVSVGDRLLSAPAAVEPAGTVSVLGVEDTKIAVLRDGVKSLLDPFKGGSYVWPSLSPDGTKLVAYETGKGTFVARPDGSQPVLIGRRDAPDWTRDGKWIVYMADTDDGHRIISSSVGFVSPDGRREGTLTADTGLVALYPRCSPVDDRIVCSTPGGWILLITYAGGSR
ncbi:MAG TPA: hypothetical protein VL221_03265 [Bacteroidota bacterium]|nr:hypothetical protein [Bacteroidota bacterium]